MSNPPTTFLCPITHELMIDPVIDPDGNSYERRAIEGWLRQNNTSPITRAPLRLEDLRPNRALQSAIEEYRQSLESPAAASSTTQNATTPLDLIIQTGFLDGFIHISMIPPAQESRSPCDICCVVDTSGSMAVQAEIQNDKNEQFGLSQLDLVKHAMKTIIKSLQPQDRLSLVSFANHATVQFQLTKMDEAGKSSALAALERLEDNGQTNLWDGLRAGLDVILKGERQIGSQAALFLLTDGCPNVEPPRGYLPTLEKLKQKTNFNCSINTFGFGYELDSKLLEDLAIIGNSGSYAFIPDGSFVGTIFVNAMTNALATVASNVQLLVKGQTIEPSDYTRWYATKNTAQGTLFDLGPVVYGQSRDLLIPVAHDSASKWEFELTYDTVQQKKKSLTIEFDRLQQPANSNAVLQQKFRLELVDRVRNVFQLKRQAQNAEALTLALNQLKALENEMKEHATDSSPYIRDLYKDLTGQVHEALSRQDWFKKWGVHFLPSLTRAHLLQSCNNFKDPGVQHYGEGALFTEIRDEMDTIFCALPAPKRAQNGTQIDMSAFHDAAGGCFHGDCTVKLMDGTTKSVKNVKPGDQLAPHGGFVKYVIKTKCQNGQAKMIAFNNGLLITAWHPIRLHGRWIMPCSLVSAPTHIRCDEVFNFALDQGHTVTVNNVECVTLGHGFQEDVVRHSYYGSDRVITDLHQLDLLQQNSGIITISEGVLVRNKQSGLVEGLKQISNQTFQQISVQ